MRTTPKTFHLYLVDNEGREHPYDGMFSHLEPHERKQLTTFPTRGDARKMGRRLQRAQDNRFVQFRIDAQRIARKRRNGTQHLSVAAPSLLQSPRWTALYRNTDLLTEVTVTSVDEPADERRFKVVGHGKPIFVLASKTELNPPRGGRMARTKSASKKKNKKGKAAPEADAEDEALLDDSELEDLDDLEDVEAEEPEDSDEDGDDEESDEDELDGLSKKELKAKAKEAGVKGYSKLSADEIRDAIRAADEEEDEDEEEEDDSDSIDEMDRSELKAALREAGFEGKFKTSQSDDDLRTLLREQDEEDEEDEDDDEEEDEVATKTKAKKGKKGKGKQAPPARELPKGKLGVEAIAKAAKVDARAVRVFLRKEDLADTYKVDGRWAFTKKQVEQLAKKVKAAQD